MHCNPTSAIWITPFWRRHSDCVTTRPTECSDWPSPAHTVYAGLRRPRLTLGSMKPRVSRAAGPPAYLEQQPTSPRRGRCRVLQVPRHTRCLAAVLWLLSNRSSSACTTGSSLARSRVPSRFNIFVFLSSPAAHQLRIPALDTIRARLERIGPVWPFAHLSEAQLFGAPSLDAVHKSER